jgi:hypothetical protein
MRRLFPSGLTRRSQVGSRRARCDSRVRRGRRDGVRSRNALPKRCADRYWPRRSRQAGWHITLCSHIHRYKSVHRALARAARLRSFSLRFLGTLRLRGLSLRLRAPRNRGDLGSPSDCQVDVAGPGAGFAAAGSSPPWLGAATSAGSVASIASGFAGSDSRAASSIAPGFAGVAHPGGSHNPMGRRALTPSSRISSDGDIRR